MGANFGVYTQAFIDGVGINGKVFAIEPEPKNLHTLKNRFSQQLKSGQLEVFEGIAASTPGDYCLSIHSCNPGGHVVSQSGMSVKGITIDQILSARKIIFDMGWIWDFTIFSGNPFPSHCS